MILIEGFPSTSVHTSVYFIGKMLKIILVLLALTNIEAKMFVEFSKSSVLLSAVLNIISDEASSNLSTLNLLISKMDYKTKLETQEIIKNIYLNKTSKAMAIQLQDIDKLRSLNIRKTFNTFFIDSYESFLSIYEILNPATFNYQGKYLIIIIKSLTNRRLDIQRIFQDLWNIHIVNVNVLIKSETKNQAELYTYFPYTNSYCSELHPLLWKTFKNGRFEGHESFYPKKMANLHQCPLNVAIFDCNFLMVKKTAIGEFETKGLDGSLLKVLSRRMNFKVNHTFLGSETLRWGFLYPNGSSSGAMKYV